MKYTNEEIQAEFKGLPATARQAFEKLNELGAPVKFALTHDENNRDYRGYFWISAEEGYTSRLWLDYYDKFWGCDTLNEVLDENGLYFEWENAGFAGVYDN